MYSVQTPPITLGEFVMLLRKRCGWTVHEAANAAQVTRKQWRDLESCRYPYVTISTLSRVMDALGFEVKFELKPNEQGGGE